MRDCRLMMRRGPGTASLVAVLVALLAFPVGASAQFQQQPAEDQYGQPPAGAGTQGDNADDGPGREQSRDDGDEDGEGNGGGGPGGGSGPGSEDRGGVGGSELPLRDAEGGSLPFTGLDLTLLVLLGVMLAGGGFAIRAGQRSAAARRSRAG